MDLGPYVSAFLLQKSPLRLFMAFSSKRISKVGVALNIIWQWQQ